MLNKLLFHNFPNIKSWLTRLQYELISMLDKDKNAIFMNFGYSSHHKGNEPLPLEIEDEIHRYPLQLYHHVAKSIDWSGRDALEVSSGRGGGANFIMQYFKPRSYTAWISQPVPSISAAVTINIMGLGFITVTRKR